MPTLANQAFGTKRAIEAHCQALLTGPLEEKDRAFLLALAQWHPNADLILGCGVRTVFVHSNGSGPTFAFERTDGSVAELNYKVCVRTPARLHAVRSYFRQLVAEQLREFRDQTFARYDLIQSGMGELVSKWQAEVGYASPQTFNGLVRDFLKEHELDVADVELESSPNDAAWVEYHARNAQLWIQGKSSQERNVSLSLQRVLVAANLDATKWPPDLLACHAPEPWCNDEQWLTKYPLSSHEEWLTKYHLYHLSSLLSSNAA